MNTIETINNIKTEKNSTTEFCSDINIHPDACLIKACEDYCAAEAMWRSHFPEGANPIDDDDARDIAQKPLRDIQAGLMDVIADDGLRAVTLEGIRARARAAAAWAQGDDLSFDGEAGEILVCLLNDLLGSGSYRPTPTKLSADFLASDTWRRACPSYSGDAN
jgi:hypothetical protein